MNFRMIILISGLGAGAWACADTLLAAQPDESALTIYSSQQPGAISADFYRPVPGGSVPPASSVPGYAMVRQDRDVQLAAGRSSLRFTDVAGLIDPTTVTFSVPANPGVRVLEQNFQFDLVSTPKLLLRYLDREITVERNLGKDLSTVTGTLLSSSASESQISSTRKIFSSGVNLAMSVLVIMLAVSSTKTWPFSSGLLWFTGHSATFPLKSPLPSPTRFLAPTSHAP